MATYGVFEARALVVDQVTAHRPARPVIEMPLAASYGEVLAENIPADRDYPAVARSIRDGYAVHARDLPGTFRVIGEVRAGATFDGIVGAGEAVEIMTGAPLPYGADQVVMVEHTRRDGDRMTTERPGWPGEFVNPRASEIREHETFVAAGTRIGISETAALAMVGRPTVKIFERPRVAILSTGDEVIPIDATPEGNQVRNSNAWALAAQVRRAGGQPVVLPVAPDEPEATRALIAQGLECDLLLLSGGVSAGKYDYVEAALATFGAEFYFDRVLIQPGQPLVFGHAQGKFLFGLPGNPASTMVCFEVFGRAALELLAGQKTSQLPLTWGRLSHDFAHKPGLTRFLGARLADGCVTQIPGQGSSDVAALARANCFLVAEATRERWAAGEMIRVLLR